MGQRGRAAEVSRQQGADVTVVLYTGMVVKANHAYAKGELSDKDVDGIVGEVSKILPQK